MKRRFRLLALTCAAMLMLALLAACGGGDKPQGEDENTTPGTTTGEDAKKDADTNKDADANKGADADKTTAGKEYIIASDTSFPPFEFLDTATNQYIGIDMDILAAISEDQGVKFTIKNVGFKPAMGEVQAGQSDGMIAGMTIDEERQKTFDFSEPYYQDGQIMVVAKGSAVKKLDDLKGKTVAAKMGTKGTEYAESISKEYDFKLVYYEDSPTMYTAVVNGNDAACFEDRSVVEYAIKSGDLKLETVGETISPKDYGFAVVKGKNAELLKIFNDGLKNIKENGKYDEILAKYGL